MHTNQQARALLPPACAGTRLDQAAALLPVCCELQITEPPALDPVIRGCAGAVAAARECPPLRREAALALLIIIQVATLIRHGRFSVE